MAWAVQVTPSSRQLVRNELGPLRDSRPDAALPFTCPNTDDEAPVFSVPDTEKAPAVIGALGNRIVFWCVW